MPFFRSIEITIKEILWNVSRSIGTFTNSTALVFYRKMTTNGREAPVAANDLHHKNWETYCGADLADLIYRTYEQDLRRFGYPHALVRRRNQMSAHESSSMSRKYTSLLIESVGSIPNSDIHRDRGEMS